MNPENKNMFVVCTQSFEKEEQMETTMEIEGAKSYLLVYHINVMAMEFTQLQKIQTPDPVEDLKRMECSLLLGNTISKIVIFKEFEQSVI